MKEPTEGEISEGEIVRRREAALKRMLNTPHKPHVAPKKERAAKAKPSRAIRAKA